MSSQMIDMSNFSDILIICSFEAIVMLLNIWLLLIINLTTSAKI